MNRKTCENTICLMHAVAVPTANKKINEDNTEVALASSDV